MMQDITNNTYATYKLVRVCVKEIFVVYYLLVLIRKTKF